MLTFTFNASGQLTLTMTPSSHNGYNVSCFGGRDGSIDLMVSGGSGNYNFQWSNNSHSEDIQDLQAGYYHVTVQDLNPPNENGEAEITLTQPDQLQLNDPIISSYPNSYCISLFGACNGSIQISPDGGATPYSYLWHDGSTNHNRWTLCQGQYSVTITDANGCSMQSEHYYISEPPRSDWSMSGNSGTTPGTQYIGTSDNKDFVIKTNNTNKIIIKSNGAMNLKGDIVLDSISPDSVNAAYTDSHGLLRLGPGSNPTQICTMPVYAFYRKLCPVDYNYYFYGSNNSIPNSKLVIGNPSSLPGSYRLYVTGGILTERLRIADAGSSNWPDFVFDKKYHLMNLSELNLFLIKNKHLPGIPTSEEVTRDGVDVAEMQGKLLQKIEELTLYLISQQNEIDQLKKDRSVTNYKK